MPFGDSNSLAAHSWFDNHAKNFAPGIRGLLLAHSLMEKFGLPLLPIPEAKSRLGEALAEHSEDPANRRGHAGVPDKFDVAISFAGSERNFAEKLAKGLREAGFSVFYDDFYASQLWGKDLAVLFHAIYGSRSRYCVIFVSNEYNNRAWTVHERRSAQERMVKEKGNDYILPIKVDSIELPGLPSTIGYVSLNELGIEKITQLLINKLSVQS